MGIMNRLFLLISIALVGYSNVYSQYKQTYNFNDYKITISETGKNRIDSKNTAVIEIKVGNNLIEKNINLKGDYVDTSYVMDYDRDKNPEIILVERNPGSGVFGQLLMYEFQSGNLKIVNFPKVPADIQKFHRGHDSFLIYQDSITHKFPAYLPDDANCCATGGECTINYKYENDRLIEISHVHVPPRGEAGFNIIIKTIVDLPKMDAFSNTDCFVEVYVDGNKIGRTRTIKNDNSPYYNEKFTASVYKGGKIEFKLYDEDFSRSRIIGKVVLAEPISGTYPVQIEDNSGNIVSKGELTVEFTKEKQ